jgi:hypothetical protein
MELELCMAGKHECELGSVLQEAVGALRKGDHARADDAVHTFIAEGHRRVVEARR